MKFENSEYDTFGVIKKLDGIYNFQSSNIKMMALAMSHYQPKNYHPGTFVRLVRVALDYEKYINYIMYYNLDMILCSEDHKN